jgi:hypothetical protein
MLKAKGLTAGKLYPRIEEAANNHIITDDMKKWAHQVRLDANDERHADSGSKRPDKTDAERCLDFTIALAEIMFTLPSRVTRGIAAAGGTS